MTATTHEMPSIESIDAFARQLYRHVRDAGPDFVDLAIAVRNLRTALQHLVSEAHDRDSPLHQCDPADVGTKNSVYTRQLRSLVEDSDFALKKASTILERYGASNFDLESGVARRDSDLAERARKIDLTRADMISQTLKIDIFLDTIQLHNTAQTQRVLNNIDAQQMDMIKDKVDTIARRLYRERKDQSPLEVDEDELWRSFKSELEQEGFAPEVLRRNKEVLRAYIRELESHQPLGGGTPPSVRGLLEWDARPPMPVASGSYPIHDRGSRPNSATGPLSNECRRRVPTPEKRDVLPLFPRPRSPDALRLPPQLSFEQETSSDSSSAEASSSSHTALISTKDLMILDRYSAERVTALSGTSLLLPIRPAFHVISPGTSPNTRYLPPGTQPISIPSHDAQPPGLAYPGALSPGLSPPNYGTSLAISSSDTGWDLATLPASAPAAGNDMPKYPSLPRQPSHLAPDSKGQTIPLDATWTKIDRKLVSPEVLEKAGVRYEARPNFVAVLGVLTREKIEEYAMRSLEVRNARNLSPTARGAGGRDRTERNRPRQETYADRYRQRRPRDSARDDGSETTVDPSDSESSRDVDDASRKAGHSTNRHRYTPEDRSSNRSSKHPDSEDDERGTQGRPVIVSPPGSVNGESLSPSSTVAPKPILKNKNPNHVRFDRSGPREISPPGHHPDRARRDPRDPREQDRRREHRDRERDWPKERDRDNKTRRDRSKERSRNRSRVRDGDRERTTKDRDEDCERDRDRDRIRDPDHRVSSKRHPDRDRDRHRERERDRERDRDKDRDRDPRGRAEEGRQPRRSALKEAAGAIGVSGAAATLLSVLTGAAAHL
ncbi:hypothetical protein N657DRAFT_581253 [Parathielavia appendiculata]|uniref:DUF8035 domain-containing protein n=1 Tax=Parathielavia appendiculata TaxID=2587402 RepID=A0AAN6TRY7_9PEZI|nr:hypothetical protein N657DRAFT_581253 [Parathielavia appendiculata]